MQNTNRTCASCIHAIHSTTSAFAECSQWGGYVRKDDPECNYRKQRSSYVKYLTSVTTGVTPISFEDWTERN